mgnify:CR=1 FL=1
MSKNPGSNKENLEKTHKLFLNIARDEFVRYGFNGTSTNQIVERSCMARGSLYYHFGDKEGLFREVYVSVLREVHGEITAQIEPISDPRKRLFKGVEAFFTICLREDVRKILLLEGLTTIPHHERMKLLEDNLVGKLTELVGDMYAHGLINEISRNGMIIFIYGLVTEAARNFEYVDQPEKLCAQFQKDFCVLLDKLCS